MQGKLGDGGRHQARSPKARLGKMISLLLMLLMDFLQENRTKKRFFYGIPGNTAPRVILPNYPKAADNPRMQFNYEIPADEFVAAQIVLHTAKEKRRLIKRAFGYTLLGVVFGLIALFRYPDLGPLLLLLVAAHLIYVGITNLFPQRYFRKAYPQSELAGKSYQADLDDNGFTISGDSCSWRVGWSEVHLKGENKRVFMFYAKGTIFIFGKKYLTDEQQRNIRRFI